MAALRRSTPSAKAAAPRGLRHVMVVGGTLADWRDLGAARWQERIDALGAAAAAEGAAWLTVRPYAAGDEMASVPRHEHTVDVSGQGCTVIVEPTADGRSAFAAAMADLDPSETATEASVASVLYAPADAEPDLVIVLGRDDRLPPSLVWELAYAELVFLDISWSDLSAEHVQRAVAEFALRNRRFGGVPE